MLYPNLCTLVPVVLQLVLTHFCFSKSLFFALNSASELINLLFRGWEQQSHLCDFFSTFCLSSLVCYLLNQFSSGSTKYRDAKYHSSDVAFTCVAVYTPLTIYLGETAYCRPATFLPGSQRLFLPPHIALCTWSLSKKEQIIVATKGKRIKGIVFSPQNQKAPGQCHKFFTKVSLSA